jgi:hypothetical protein
MQVEDLRPAVQMIQAYLGKAERMRRLHTDNLSQADMNLQRCSGCWSAPRLV